MNQDCFPSPSSSVLLHITPASDWAEAYPLGDGRIGAMVYGRPTEEIYALNHDLLWRSFLSQPVYGTKDDMPQIKQLCREKKWREAEKLLCQTVPSRNAVYINPFVPACDLYLTMFLDGNGIKNYRRALDLAAGTATVEFEKDGVIYRRVSFCSHENHLFVTHLTASLPGMLSGEVSLSRIGDPECTVIGSAEYDTVNLSGAFEEGKHFAACTRLYHRNGRLTGGKKTYGTEHDRIPEKKYGLGYLFNRDEMLDAEKGASVCFDSCDEITILTAITTDIESDTQKQDCLQRTHTKESYQQLKEKHIAQFSSYYNRTKLTLSQTENCLTDSVTELLLHDQEKKVLSPELCERMYQMSRYTAIASGMPANAEETPKAPINLQGLWNRDTRPAWESDYHMDLNIEMCYWPLAAMGLSDFYEPLLQWAERLLPQAKHCAKDLYGAEGAAYNGCCDYQTLGVTDYVGATWLGGSAWLMQILWIAYEHSPSAELLTRIYNLMKECASFYESMFIVENDGIRTFPFGASPEMSFMCGDHRQWLSSASSCDLILVRELYQNLCTAAKILSKEEAEEHIPVWTDILCSLKQPVIDSLGYLQEWTEPHKEAEPNHRHRSPFVGFCPGSLYTLEKNPDICSALSKLLEKRLLAGNGMSTSFSYAWDAQIFARLGQGERAYEKLYELMSNHSLEQLLLTTNQSTEKKGSIAWFPGIKVMQMDALLCMSSAVSEMLYQDQGDLIRLLPALPDALQTGSFTGIHGRNGFVTDLFWEHGKITKINLTSLLGKECHIRFPSGQKPLQMEIPDAVLSDTEELTFPTVLGKTYSILFRKY